MPTYAYACTSCGHRFDIYQAFSDDALTECPECGGALRKQFGNVGVVFKGSGFYRNDARGTDSTSSSSSDSSSTTSSSSSDKPATESKPAKESKPAAKESSTASTAAASTAS